MSLLVLGNLVRSVYSQSDQATDAFTVLQLKGLNFM